MITKYARKNVYLLLVKSIRAGLADGFIGKSSRDWVVDECWDKFTSPILDNGLPFDDSESIWYNTLDFFVFSFAGINLLFKTLAFLLFVESINCFKRKMMFE